MFGQKGKLQLLIEIQLQKIIVDYEKANILSDKHKFYDFLHSNHLEKGICRRIEYSIELNTYMKELIHLILGNYKSTYKLWYKTPSFIHKQSTIDTRIQDLKQIKTNLPREWKLKWELLKIIIKQFFKK